MKDLVLTSLRRNLEEMQRSTAAGADMADQLEAVQQQIAAMVRPQVPAAPGRSVADSARAFETVRRQAAEFAVVTATQVAREAPPELAHRVSAAVERALAEQQSMFEQALQEMQEVFHRELARAQAEQAGAFRRQLDPFARDWESEADSIYDDAE